MKKIHLLTTLFVCLGFIALTAQTSESKEDTRKRVIVIKKSIDKNGEKQIDKIIAEGTEADNLIKEFEVDGDMGDLVFDFDYDYDFEVKRDHKPDEDRNTRVIINEENGHKVIEIIREGESPKLIELEEGAEISRELREQLENDGVFIHDQHRVNILDDQKFIRVEKIGEGVEEIMEIQIDGEIHQKLNCAALGVYVNSGDQNGLRIRSLIEEGGAKKAGLLADDVLVSVGSQPVSNHKELLAVLADFEPGETVQVSYLRNGIEASADVMLTSWKELPSMKNSWRAEVSCGDDNYQHSFNFLESPKEITRKIIIVKKQKLEEEPKINVSPDITGTNERSLELVNFQAFPNPTDGQLKVQFEAQAIPTIVRIMDVSGKEVYREELTRFNGLYNQEINLTGSGGTYLLSVEQEEKIFTRQIVVN
jgi:hypothetical protein